MASSHEEALTMPHQLISHLKEGDAVQQYFLVRQVESRTTKSGKPFLELLLGDKTGTLKAKVWAEALERVPKPWPASGDAVGVQGKVKPYLGELQLEIQHLYTELTTSKGFKVVNEPYEVSVGSRKFVRGDFSKQLGTLTMQQSSLVVVEKGYVLSFTFISGTDDEADELIENLSFGASKSPGFTTNPSKK